jgi:hypothetical protein
VLRQAVAEQIGRGNELKRRALFGALDFLDRRLDLALAPLWSEVAQAKRWQEIVDRLTRTEFLDRYRAGYLDGEKYVDFNQTLVKLMDLLEIPGIGPLISGVSKGLKAVSRFVIQTVARGFRSVFSRWAARAPRGPELDVVALAFEQWIEALRAEAQALCERENHSAWPQIQERLASAEFLETYGDALGAAYQGYRARMDQLTTDRARALYELIKAKPALVNTLRGLKVTLDVGTTALIVSSGGLNWTDAVIAPLVAPGQRLILEFGLDQYMAAQKAQLKADQLAALRAVVDERMVAPIRALYPSEFDSERLAGSRRDLHEVRDTLKRQIGDG